MSTAEGAGPRTALQGLREGAREADQRRSTTIPKIKPGDPYPFSARRIRIADLLKNWDAPTSAPKPAGTPESAHFAATSSDADAVTSDDYLRLLRRHDLGRSSRRGRLGRIRHTERRLAPGRHRRQHRRRPEPSGCRASSSTRRKARSTSSRPASTRASRSRRRSRLKTASRTSCFSVQGGDSQDQNLLQFFLNVVEFGMTVQEATEAPNINSFQMHSSFGAHDIKPGNILLNSARPPGSAANCVAWATR